MPITIAEILSDFPAIMDLVQAAEKAVEDEKTAVSFTDKYKAIEPVILKAAALVDTIKAQIGS